MRSFFSHCQRELIPRGQSVLPNPKLYCKPVPILRRAVFHNNFSTSTSTTKESIRIMTEEAVKYAETHKDKFIEHLKDIVRIPSVSAWPETHHSHVLQCAHEVKKQLDRVGLHNTKFLTLKSEADHNNPKVPPCVYDVQPPETASPWEPVVVHEKDQGGDRLFGRGSADDKASITRAGIMAHLGALESILSTSKTLPINVKILFEGEEEIGSDNLEKYLEENLALLKSDILILTDTANYDVGKPALTYSLRGIAQLDVELRTVDHSVHSGLWGGAIIDPLTALCKLIGTLHDDHGRIAVEHFSDGVRAITDKERKSIASLEYTEEKMRKESGLLEGVKITGDPTQAILERIWLAPSITVIALDACNLAQAANKILHSAKARLSCRIVADQDPEQVVKALKAHLVKHCPYGAQITIDNVQTVKPWVCVPTGEVFAAAEKALQAGYGSPLLLTGCGGSIGFVEPFAKAFGGAPALLVGVEDPYTNAHGENESLCISDFHKCVKSMIHLFHNLRK